MRSVCAVRSERARGRAAESVTRSARASSTASCTRSRCRWMPSRRECASAPVEAPCSRLIGAPCGRARCGDARRSHGREARRKIQGGSRSERERMCRAADALCAVSAAGRSQAKGATYSGQARPPAPEACPAVLRRARHDSEKRGVCERDGGEGARDAGIVLTGLSEDPDSKCLLWVLGAHELGSAMRSGGRILGHAARAFSTSGAAREGERNTVPASGQP
jgi:hypothetical protein